MANHRMDSTVLDHVQVRRACPTFMTSMVTTERPTLSRKASSVFFANFSSRLALSRFTPESASHVLHSEFVVCYCFVW